MIPELDAPPTAEETTAAIKQLQAGKAPGPDGIPAEIFKAGGETIIIHLTKLFQLFWIKGQLPQDLRDANIIHLYKNKGMTVVGLCPLYITWCVPVICT